MLGKALGASAAFGPAGWAIGGGLLAASLLGSKKSNKQFEGTIQTGGHQAFKQAGGEMAVIKKGYIPTADEFVQHGRNLLPEDSYAHDYGGTFSEDTRKYYGNFRNEAQKYLDQANAAPEGSREQKVAMAHYENTMKGHGFDIQKAPKPAPEPARRSAPAPEAAPAPTATAKEVSPPGSGLEDTVVAPPSEAPPPSYLYPDRPDRYPTEEVVDKEFLQRRMRGKEDEETGADGSFLTVAG
jgi:hypothetical protein